MDVREPRTIAAKIATIQRYQPETDVTELYRELHHAKITKYVRELAAKFPPLSDDQRATIGQILGGRTA